MFGGLKEKDLTVLSHLGRYFPTKKCEEFFFFFGGGAYYKFSDHETRYKRETMPIIFSYICI